ncbi:MAG: hypothetical protein KKF65_06300 [Nanoarchaeota archaeon]|nr:hypothetical protein [Nanoarchaeota archaeon]
MVNNDHPHYVGVLVFLCVVIIVGFGWLLFSTKTTDLPPEPPIIGEGITNTNLGGLAFYPGDEIPSEYAPPWDIFNYKKMIFTITPDEFIINMDDLDEENTISIEANHPEGLIYKYGYLYYLAEEEWGSFEFEETTIEGSNWIKNYGSIIEKARNEDLLELGAGEYYLVAYSCKKHDGEWKCGCKNEKECGYWMIQSFNIQVEESELPPEPSFCGNGRCETGETTANCPEDCDEEISNTTCTDSDGGIQYYTYGECTQCNTNDYSGACLGTSDNCVENSVQELRECYCQDNHIKTTTYECPNGCEDGACIKEPLKDCETLQEDSSANQYFVMCANEGYDDVCFNKFTGVYQGCVKDSFNDCTINNANAEQNILCDVEKPICYDSDGGLNYYVGGTTLTYNNSFSDVCAGNTELKEGYCQDGKLEIEYYKCPVGCNGRTCMGTPNCKETDEGKDFYNKGYLSANCNNLGECGTYDDFCFTDNTTLREFYCDGEIKRETVIECPYGCDDGACL